MVGSRQQWSASARYAAGFDLLASSIDVMDRAPRTSVEVCRRSTRSARGWRPDGICTCRPGRVLKIHREIMIALMPYDPPVDLSRPRLASATNHSRAYRRDGESRAPGDTAISVSSLNPLSGVCFRLQRIEFHGGDSRAAALAVGRRANDPLGPTPRRRRAIVDVTAGRGGSAHRWLPTRAMMSFGAGATARRYESAWRKRLRDDRLHAKPRHVAETRVAASACWPLFPGGDFSWRGIACINH